MKIKLIKGSLIKLILVIVFIALVLYIRVSHKNFEKRIYGYESRITELIDSREEAMSRINEMVELNEINKNTIASLEERLKNNNEIDSKEKENNTIFFIQAESSEMFKLGMVDHTDMFIAPSVESEVLNNITGTVLVHNVVQTINDSQDEGSDKFKNWAFVEYPSGGTYGNHMGYLELDSVNIFNTENINSTNTHVEPDDCLNQHYFYVLSNFGLNYDFRKNEFDDWYIQYIDYNLTFFIDAENGTIYDFHK